MRTGLQEERNESKISSHPSTRLHSQHFKLILVLLDGLYQRALFSHSLRVSKDKRGASPAANNDMSGDLHNAADNLVALSADVGVWIVRVTRVAVKSRRSTYRITAFEDVIYINDPFPPRVLWDVINNNIIKINMRLSSPRAHIPITYLEVRSNITPWREGPTTHMTRRMTWIGLRRR
jgi:hypothetical protein